MKSEIPTNQCEGASVLNGERTGQNTVQLGKEFCLNW